MSYIIKHPILLTTVILWLGFVLAISFMEAWLKFRAPGVTLPIGLSIGRLVFSVLNKVEWLFAILLVAHLLLYRNDYHLNQMIITSILLLILLLQTFWLLPLLDARAELHIRSEDVQPSALHLYYVNGELLKVAVLITLIITLIKQLK